MPELSVLTLGVTVVADPSSTTLTHAVGVGVPVPVVDASSARRTSLPVSWGAALVDCKSSKRTGSSETEGTIVLIDEVTMIARYDNERKEGKGDEAGKGREGKGERVGGELCVLSFLTSESEMEWIGKTGVRGKGKKRKRKKGTE